MYVMTGRISFPELTDEKGNELYIRRFEEVHIERSLKQMTQSATVTFPRANFLSHDKEVKKVFRVGMYVRIELGYDGDMKEEYSGYITRVSADIPVKLTLADEMWKARKIMVNYVSKSTTLKKLLEDVAHGYEVDAPDIELGAVRFSKVLLGDVLKMLRKDWKINSYFIGKKLVSGKYYSEYSEREPVKFVLEKNTVSNQLNYKNSEDIILRLNATSVLVNGSKLKYSVGNDGGETMNLTYFNIKAKAELKKKAEEDYKKAKQGGFDGSFTAFGMPSVTFGMKADLKSSIYPDRNGVYYIDGVKKSFGEDGYRQDITLGGSARFD